MSHFFNGRAVSVPIVMDVFLFTTSNMFAQETWHGLCYDERCPAEIRFVILLRTRNLWITGGVRAELE